jgi:hypothetical protein
LFVASARARFAGVLVTVPGILAAGCRYDVCI